MGPIGIQEMMGLILIALLLFGPKKLPELGRMLGRGLSEFRRMKSEFSRTFETHMRELEREARLSELESSQKSIPPASSYNASNYSYPYEATHADGVAITPVENEPAQIASESAPEDLYEPPVMTHAVNDTVARSNVDFSKPSNGSHNLGSHSPVSSPYAQTGQSGQTGSDHEPASVPADEERRA